MKKKLRRLAAALAVLAALGWGASLGIDWYCEARPPRVEPRPAVAKEAARESEDGYRRLGPCYIGRKDGILRMYLEGAPFERGYTNAVLTQPYFEQQEQELLDTVREHVPSDVALWLLKKYVTVRNRNLASHVRMPQQLEIYGVSSGYRDRRPELGPMYHRLLNYHAAHDISHAVMDSPLVECTSFAAWGKATANGHLLLGRNFDFRAGRLFDENKIVMRVKPDQGLGYISVAWAGMIGVVSGINDAKIAVTINASQSASKKSIGTPVSLVLQQVMQDADTLDEAIEIIRAARVFVSDLFLVADGKSGEAVIVEKTPGHCAVRRAEGDYIVCANHFTTDPLRNDTENRAYMQEATSAVRMERMEALVRARAGSLTPEGCAEILRDRDIGGGKEVGLGNAASINSLVATHSVIVDVTDGVVWVSAAPHQLGAYVPFGLETFENPPNKAIISPDPMLADGAYERYSESDKLIARAEALIEEEKLGEVPSLLAEAARLNPGYYRPSFLLGKLSFARGDYPAAEKHLHDALSHWPPYASERASAHGMLDAIAGSRGG